MADKKISELPQKLLPAPTDALPIVDTTAGPLITKKTTFANVLQAFSLLSRSDIGTPSGAASLDNAGKVPVEQLPAIAINDTFVVNSENEMTELVVETGDIAIRLDINKSFVLRDTPATNVNNWIELVSTASPTINNVDGGNF